MRIYKPLAALAAACALCLTACSSTSITGASLALPEQLEKGSTAKAQAEFSYNGDAPSAEKAAQLESKLALGYTSSDPSVVIVDADGNISAVGAGTAEITLASKDGKITASQTVQVVISPTSIEFPTELALTEGETAVLEATVQPEDATVQTLVFTSSDESIATVSSSGEVTAIAAGEATIIAAVEGSEVSAECTVTVSAPEPEPTPAPTAQPGQSGAGQSQESASQNSTQSTAPDAPSAAGFETGALPAVGSGWWTIDSTDDAYWAVAHNINAMRAEVGLPELSVSDSLSSIAYDRCEYQAAHNTLTHDGAVTSEILAQSQRSAAEVCQAWKTSPAHYAVITNPNHTQMGICCAFDVGQSAYIWCVTFQ